MYDKSDILLIGRRDKMEQSTKDTTLFDSTVGIWLTPSYHGQYCLGNGEHPDIECCCDECDYYLACFPDWKTFIK